jgi:hypothetical protein
VRLAHRLPDAAEMAEPRYRAAQCVAAGRCNDATFLLNKKTGRYYKLDDVGGELWALLRRSPCLNALEIVHALSTVYDVAPPDITKDVTALIDTLVDYAVIDIESATRRG